MRFSKGTDYKTAFIVAVNELISEKIMDRKERMNRIDSLISEYITDTGETPNSKQLERLADYVLMEELTDKHPDKITREEYPFMSDWQLDLRRDNECGLKITEDTGTDGINYRTPTRRKRTSSENESVDKFAKIRNEERRKQYRKDTTPGELISYKLS